jgi:hypothetical protein
MHLLYLIASSHYRSKNLKKIVMTNATNSVARVAAAVAGLGLVAMSFAPLAGAQTTTTTTTSTRRGLSERASPSPLAQPDTSVHRRRQLLPLTRQLTASAQL